MMAPRNLMVAPAGDSGIYVKWELPDETSEPVLGYVVDWRDAVDSNNQLFVWKRIPRDNHSLFIGQISSPQEHGAERSKSAIDHLLAPSQSEVFQLMYYFNNSCYKLGWNFFRTTVQK